MLTHSTPFHPVHGAVKSGCDGKFQFLRQSLFQPGPFVDKYNAFNALYSSELTLQSVGTGVGDNVGDFVGRNVGFVGDIVGAGVGAVTAYVGLYVGTTVGDDVGV